MGLARSRPPGPLRLTAADSGGGPAQLMQEEAIGPPVGSRCFEDIDRCGIELVRQSWSFLNQPQGSLEILVGDTAVAEDLLAVGERMDESGMADLLVRVDTTGQVETVFEGFAPLIIVAEGVVIVFEAGIEQTGVFDKLKQGHLAEI
ncbi:MAG: hypothetical protein QHJ74_17790 [Anaerolineae bacterium]|nr:hypothetical protein [Anaerolineae bacterium]